MYILRVDPKVTKKLFKVNFFNVQALKLNFPATPCITLAKAHLIESLYSAKRCFPHVLEQQITKIQKIIAGKKSLVSSQTCRVNYYAVHFLQSSYKFFSYFLGFK